MVFVDEVSNYFNNFGSEREENSGQYKCSTGRFKMSASNCRHVLVSTIQQVLTLPSHFLKIYENSGNLTLIFSSEANTTLTCAGFVRERSRTLRKKKYYLRKWEFETVTAARFCIKGNVPE